MVASTVVSLVCCGTICASSLVIVTLLAGYMLKRADAPFPGLAWVFAAYVVAAACGGLAVVVSLLWPFLAWVLVPARVGHALVAGVSAFAFLFHYPRLLGALSPAQYEGIIAKNNEITRELKNQLAATMRLEHRFDSLLEIQATRSGTEMATDYAIDRLDAAVDRLAALLADAELGHCVDADLIGP